MSIAQKLKTVAENQQKVYAAGYAEGQRSGNYGEGYEAGQLAEYDRFWDAYQQNGNRGDYQYAFYNWDYACYNPKYPIHGVIANSFRGSVITNTQVPIVAKNSSANAFYGCSSLVTIPSLDISGSSNTSYMFLNTNSLVDVRFFGDIPLGIDFSKCANLSDASIQSIIDHLKDLRGATAQTLTFHATVGGKLTEAQKASITAKNWTLVY